MNNIPSVRVFLLRPGIEISRSGDKVRVDYLQVTPDENLVLNDRGSLFQVYTNGNGISLSTINRKNLWLQFTNNPDQPVRLISVPEEASIIDVSTAQPVNSTTLQLDLTKLNQTIRDSLANLGSFGILLNFNRKIFGTENMASPIIGTGIPNPDLTTQEACEATNAYWDSVNQQCLSCQSGVQFPDRVNLTCLDCPVNGLCGGENGYCNGSTASNAPCIENPETQTWSANCTENKCGGQCGGDCPGKAFGVTCQLDEFTGLYKCAFDKGKWWALFLWLLFFVLIIVVIIIGIVIAVRLKHKKTPMPVTKTPIVEIAATPVYPVYTQPNYA